MTSSTSTHIIHVFNVWCREYATIAMMVGFLIPCYDVGKGAEDCRKHICFWLGYLAMAPYLTFGHRRTLPNYTHVLSVNRCPLTLIMMHHLHLSRGEGGAIICAGILVALMGNNSMLFWHRTLKQQHLGQIFNVVITMLVRSIIRSNGKNVGIPKYPKSCIHGLKINWVDWSISFSNHIHKHSLYQKQMFDCISGSGNPWNCHGLGFIHDN